MGTNWCVFCTRLSSWTPERDSPGEQSLRHAAGFKCSGFLDLSQDLAAKCLQHDVVPDWLLGR